tara:strand:+ start:159 stop:338 length:180 start_codon:yes stop_codon:yes gene_type:complete
MKKKFIIEFTHSDGKVEEVEFVTERGYEWTVDQYSRNRAIVKHELIEESAVKNKQMLFG